MRKIWICITICIIVISGCKSDKKQQIKGTGDSAIDALSELIDKEPEDHTLLFDRAKQFYSKELFDEAIADMKTAISIDSMVPDYYHFLSDVFMDYYKSKESLATMERARFLFPERIQTMLKLCETEFILKKFDEAQYSIQNVLIRDPQNANAYFMLGMLERERKNIDKAKSAFQTATEFDPELTDAWLFLGSIYEDEKNPLAYQYYKQATEINGRDVNAWHSLAFYLQNHDKIDEALEIYKKINDIDRNYNPAFLNAGILYLEKDETELAFEQFNILTKIDPTNAIAYYYRGQVYKKQGNLDLAKTDFQNALNLNPDYDKAKAALRSL